MTPQADMATSMQAMTADHARDRTEGDEDMLATIALVLIVLWLLGFFAFHVGSSLIHIVLVVGLIVLVLHFLRGR